MARINIAIMGYPLGQTIIVTTGVNSFNGRTGVITPQSGDYTPSQVGADASGTASTLLSNHVGLSDPHVQYQSKSDLENIIDAAISAYDADILNPLVSPMNLRATKTITTSLLVTGESEIGQVLLAKSYQLRRIESNVPCRIRLYMTSTDLTNDLGRPFIDTPPINSGVVIDFQTSIGNLSYRLDYPIEGYDDEIIPDGYIPFSITNLDNVDSVVELSITYLRTE